MVADGGVPHLFDEGKRSEDVEDMRESMGDNCEIIHEELGGGENNENNRSERPPDSSRRSFLGNVGSKLASWRLMGSETSHLDEAMRERRNTDLGEDGVVSISDKLPSKDKVAAENDQDDSHSTTDSVVEVNELEYGEREARDNDENLIDNDEEFRNGVLPIGVLVNDRRAGATLKIHLLSANSIWKFYLFVIVLAAASFAATLLAVFWVFELEPSERNIPLIYVAMAIRGVSTLIGSVSFFTYASVVIFVLHNKSVSLRRGQLEELAYKVSVFRFWLRRIFCRKPQPEPEVDIPAQSSNKRTRTRSEIQLVLLILMGCAWVSLPLNPAIYIIQWHYLIPQLNSDRIRQLQIWYNGRYAGVANSLFVSSVFHAILVFFKCIRADTIRRKRAMRTELRLSDWDVRDESLRSQSLDVRSLTGIVPRVTGLYAIARIVMSQVFLFDMGWIPCFSWISLIRICATSGSGFECLNGIGLARVSGIVIFSFWEIAMVVWILVEKYRTIQVFRLTFLFQNRSALISFEFINVLTFIAFVSFLVTTVIISSTEPTSFLVMNGGWRLGIDSLAEEMSLVLATWLAILCYLHLPRDLHLRFWPRCLHCRGFISHTKPGTFYYHSYAEAHSKLLNTEEIPGEDHSSFRKSMTILRPISILSENDRYTVSPSDPELLLKSATSEMIDRCISSESIFSFDMMVLLWNFSHAVYLTGNASFPQSDNDVSLLVEDERFSLIDQLLDSKRDTYCAVFASSEVVIVAYRGKGNTMWSPMEDSNHLRAHGLAEPLSTVSNIPVIDSANHDNAVLESDTESRYERGSIFSCRRSFRSLIDRISFFVDLKAAPALVLREILELCSDTFMHIVELLLKLQSRKRRPVFFTGHGLGGAMASIAAYVVSNQSGLENTLFSVYTFGCPKFCNFAFKVAFETRIRNCFDCANHADVVHGFSVSESLFTFFFKPLWNRTLVRIGKMLLLDGIGNLIFEPDWLDMKMIAIGEDSQLRVFEPSAYTTALMAWSQRLYPSDCQRLWSSPLHDVKLLAKAANSSQRESLRSIIVDAYLRSSIVGDKPYMGGVCIRINVLRITGLTAEESSCFLSCGPQGIGSSFWEVGKTGKAKLCQRTLTSIRGTEIGIQKGTDDKVDSPVDNSFLHLRKRASEERLNLDLDGTESDYVAATANNELLRDGVDADALASYEARYADFSSSHSIYFGTFQSLRPCAFITICGVDTNFGNYGKVTFPVTELFPLKPQEKKKVSFLLSGPETEKNEVKVHLEVESVGKAQLHTLYDAQNVSQQSSGKKFNSAYDQSELLLPGGFRPDLPETKPIKVRLAPSMATFFLKRNFNLNSQRVVFQVGVIRAVLHTLDLKLQNQTIAEAIRCVVEVGSECGTTTFASKTRLPTWNQTFKFGKNRTLTGFEEVCLTFYGNWALARNPVSRQPSVLNLNGELDNKTEMALSGNTDFSMTTKQSNLTYEDSRVQDVKDIKNTGTSDEMVIAKASIPLAQIIDEFQDSLLVKWISVPINSQSGSINAQLPGKVCLSFMLATEWQKQGKLGSKKGGLNNFSSDDSGSDLACNSGKRLEKEIGSQTTGSTLSTAQGMSALDGSDRRFVVAPLSMPENVADPFWTLDERSCIVHVNVSSAGGLCEILGDVSSLNRKQIHTSQYAVSSQSLGKNYLSAKPTLNPFCEVSLLDPLSEFAILQKKKTVIVRGCSVPVWNEVFTFGEEENAPVRGNEIVSVAVYHWQFSGETVKFGEVRIPLLSFDSAKKKSFNNFPLDEYDEFGAVVEHSNPRCTINFQLSIESVNSPNVQSGELESLHSMSSPIL